MERHDPFEAFFNATVSYFDEIAESSATDWNPETTTDAELYRHAPSDFKIIAALCVTKNVLSYTFCLTLELQGKRQDIVRAYRNNTNEMLAKMLMMSIRYGLMKLVHSLVKLMFNQVCQKYPGIKLIVQTLQLLQ